MSHVVATEDAIRWLRSLPAGSVDHMLSDPPYSSGGFNESQRRSGSSTSDVMPWLQGDALGTLAMSHLLREVALDLLCALLSPVVEAGAPAVIADPFAGSGSLIEACARLGLTAWCCDADPAHAPAMERRAHQRGLQGGLL